MLCRGGAHVYGDSSGDKELLALADVPHYKPFNNK